jgi:ABC-2 type transport system ATP-binding protein
LSEPVVALDEVTKFFGGLVAVSEVSFTIGDGVTALLGPNGAGKSTVMRMLCGLTAPSRGTVRVLGRDPRRDVDLARQIGLVPQQDGIFENQTALQFVRLAATLHGLDDPEGAARRALDVVEMSADEPKKLGTYSKGMRQRVKIAQGIVHDPRVIVLDEPLTGLDPRQRLHMVELFHRIGDSGRCVVVSSHVLEEVERFGSRVLVIAQGRLAAEGDFRAIRALMDDRPHRVRLRTDMPRELAGALLAQGLAMAVRVEDDGRVLIDTTDIVGFRRGVAPVARQLGAHLRELKGLDDDLESVFRYLVSAR